MAAEQTLDARGLSCPLPVLKARKRLLALAPGDFRLYSSESGHRLVEEGERDGVFELVLERSP